MTLQLWERRGGTVSPLGSGHIPQGAGADGGGLGLARLKDGLLPQPCLKAPQETQEPPSGQDPTGSTSSPGPPPRQPSPLSATGQALGRVTHLPPPSAPSSFLQGPAWAGNGVYPDPIRMLARLLPAARGGRARGGQLPGLWPPAPGPGGTMAGAPPEARVAGALPGAWPSVQASRLADPGTPER